MSNADTLRKLTLRRVFSFRKLLHVPTIMGRREGGHGFFICGELTSTLGLPFVLALRH